MKKIEFGPNMTELLIDAKRTYFTKAATATSEQQVDGAWYDYRKEVARLIDASNIGDGQGNSELDIAKQRYLESLVSVKTRNDSTDARRTYEDEVLRVVNENLPLEIGPADGEEEEEDVDDEPALRVKRDAKPPTVVEPERQPATTTASPRISVELIDSYTVSDDTDQIARELEQALAMKVSPDEILTAKLNSIEVESIYTEYDKNLTERWKQPPPQIKRKKGART